MRIVVVKTCAFCGKSFKPRTRPGGLPKVYCSPKCNSYAQHAKARAQRMAAKEGRVCSECGNPLSLEQPSYALTCSGLCNERRTQRVTRERRQREKTQRARAPCKHCGTAIPPEVNLKRKYCSVGCRSAAAGVRYREKNPDAQRVYLYGLESYDEMIAAQDGRCDVCGSDDPGRRKRFDVDHDHKTGKIRGLLCTNCNTALGLMKDDPARLKAAIAYLRRHGR